MTYFQLVRDFIDANILTEFYAYQIKNVAFNPFPNKPWFLGVCSTSLLKTLWEKEFF